MIQVGHHAVVDGEEGKVALAGRLHHAEDVQRPRAPLADPARHAHASGPEPAPPCLLLTGLTAKGGQQGGSMRARDAWDRQRSRIGSGLERPQAAVGCQRIAAAAGHQAEGRPDALLPVRSIEVALRQAGRHGRA